MTDTCQESQGLPSDASTWRREKSLEQTDFVLSSDWFTVLARYIYILYFGSNVKLTLGPAGCISGSRWYSCHSQAVSVSVPVDVGQRAHPAGSCVRERQTVWVRMSYIRGFNGGTKVERPTVMQDDS